MKRILSLIMVCILILTLTACGKTDDHTPSEEQAAVPTTPASILFADFKNLAENGATNPEEIANQLMTNPVIEFSPVVMPVEPGFLNGFSSDITGFDQAAVFAPMIGSIPFVGYVFSVSQDVDSFVQLLRSNADLRWNICTQADEMVCEAVGSMVFFVMAPSSFES